MPLEFEEAPEVDAGERLVTVPCSVCGAGCLAAPSFQGRPLCGECRPAPVVVRTEHYHPGGWWSCGPASELPDERSPAPIVSAREVTDMPGAVLSLADAARGWGWSVKIMYSRGYGPKRYRGRWQEEELYAVRFGGHRSTARQAYAVYRTIAGRGDWIWRSVWVWGPDLPPFGMFGVTELREYLREESRGTTDEVLALCARVRVRKLEAVREAKVRASARPKVSKAKEGAS
jgi:hypothetical protein